MGNRGNVERHFKYRYWDFNYPIGTLTEYFKFTNPQAVEPDLNKIKAKVVLSPVEQDILVGKQDDFLAALLADEQMAASNVRVSDRTEADLKQSFLAQPWSQQVIAALHQGCSLRDAGAASSVSVEVARKVLAAMQKG